MSWGLIDGPAMGAPQADPVNGWPMTQHDPGGTSYAPAATPPKDGVRVRWKQQLEMNDSPIHPPPIVANGLVYGIGQKLVCVTTTSGDVVFRSDHNAGPPALAVARAYQSPTLACPTLTGAVGLNPQGGLSVAGLRVGLTRWQAHREETGSPNITVSSSQKIRGPVAADGTVFVTSVGSVGLQAIDASSGRIRWRSHHGKSRPAVREGTVYVVALAKTGDFSLFGYDTETGEQTFSLNPPDQIPTSVTAAPEYIVVGTDSSGLLGVDYNGMIRWEYAPTELLLRQYPTPIAVADGVVYAGFEWDRNWLVAIDATNGTELWRTEVSTGTLEPEFDSPAVANDVVYVPTEYSPNGGGGLTAVDATDGHVRWRFSPGDSTTSLSPAALVGETLYVLGNGHLYALEEQ
jgi:outer membrane protein assembly factor BamB